MSENPLLVSQDGPVVTLTMNRPQALNALSGEMRRQLIARLDELNGDSSVRVAILTGTGRAFTAGLDLKELATSKVGVGSIVDSENVGAAIDRFSKPLIAAVNGLAVTGGMEILLACDIVFAADTAQFADTHVKVGLAPGWGLSQRLSRLVGVFRAKEMSLSARFVTAREAEQWGLVNRVVPPADLMPQALDLAHAIAKWEPAAVQKMKRLIDQGYTLPLGEALALEATAATTANAGVVMQSTVLEKR